MNISGIEQENGIFPDSLLLEFIQKYALNKKNSEENKDRINHFNEALNETSKVVEQLQTENVGLINESERMHAELLFANKKLLDFTTNEDRYTALVFSNNEQAARVQREYFIKFDLIEGQTADSAI